MRFIREALIPEMAATISGVLITCLKHYDKVLEQVPSHYFEEVPRQLWEDERGRLRLWASNIGAHQRGTSSLDYRLRDASHVKGQVMKLLERYDEVLRELRPDLFRQLSQQTQPDQEYMDDEFSDDEDHETETQSIYKSLVCSMNALFKLSMIIRNPTQHDRILNTQREDSIHFGHYDQAQVVEKFPDADKAIISRLGAAI